MKYRISTFPAALAGVASLVLLSGCGPVSLVATTNIPAPLVVKIPVGIALFLPKEFKEYAHNEERWSTDWHVDLGKAQTDGVTRLMNAMFESVVMVDSLNAGSQLGSQIRAIIEPSIEEYAFVTPRDAGSPFFAVSIKYRVNVYTPDGKLADSWGFTGYGTSPSQGLSSTTPLAAATALAMRDAGAKLAVEFREQAVVRGLLPASESADTSPAAAGASGTQDTPVETVAPIAAPGAAPASGTQPVEPPGGTPQPVAPESPGGEQKSPGGPKPEEPTPERDDEEKEPEPVAPEALAESLS